MADEPAVEAAGLRKSYGGVLALAGVDLRVPAGSRCAVLGPNGAGKTTTVRILATLTRPDAGQARVAGCDIARDQHRLRRRISLTGQFTGLDAQQTGAENLRMVARLSGLPAGRPGAGRPSCWTSSAWPRPPAGGLAPIRAACGGGSTWPHPWSPGRQ